MTLKKSEKKLLKHRELSKIDKILFLSIILFLFFSISFLLTYYRIKFQEVGIFTGEMSIIPTIILTANFTPSYPNLSSEFDFTPIFCNNFKPRVCKLCKECLMDIYEEHNGEMQIIERNLYLYNLTAIKINYTSNPMWVDVKLPNGINNKFRVPFPNFLKTIDIMSKGINSKMDPYTTVITALIALSTIISSIIKFLKWIGYRIKKKNEEPPDYIG